MACNDIKFDLQVSFALPYNAARVKIKNRLMLNNEIKVVLIKVNPEYNFEPFLKYLPTNAIDKIMAYCFKKDQVVSFASEYLKYFYLANYLNIPPSAVKISYNKFNKPFLVNHIDIDFNISHSNDRVVMIIANHARVGIDIEAIDPQMNINELAPLVFSKNEQILINNNPQNFFSLWCKKEALIKANGTGFAENTDYLYTNLSLAEHETIDNSIFYLCKIDNYMLAVCVTHALLNSTGWDFASLAMTKK